MEDKPSLGAQEEVRSFHCSAGSWTAQNPLIIAEIGTGHGGELSKAFELIDAASEAGASCAKFQHVYAKEIIHPATGLVPLPGGDTPLYEIFQGLERSIGFYAQLKERTEGRGMIFLCTPFGAKSAQELIDLSPKLMKVASPELNHLPLLRQLAASGIATILSSGVSSLEDIKTALACFSAPTALLHCVTAYPAPPQDYNLRLLPKLSSLLGIPLGVSDHSLDPILIPLLSLACGACIIEKHFCLSRSDSGLDDPIALDPQDFKRMTMRIVEDAEKASSLIIGRLEEEYGKNLVDACLGDGVKRLAPAEKANYGRTNRSLHALVDIRAGDAFSPENVAILRTEKILRPGLEPAWYEAILTRKAARDIEAGQGIVWEDLGPLLPQAKE